MEFSQRFKNRTEAGRFLAEKLLKYQSMKPLILAIPRGGVPVAAEVAEKLHADLDLLMVKKIGAPDNRELAIGAISEDGQPWLNSRIISRLGIKTATLKKISAEKALEVKAQIQKLRGSKKAVPVEGRVLIVIDDGIATGATLLAAVHLLRARKPKKIIIAAPVAPESTLEEIRKVADDVVALKTPYPFYAVGDWYHEFTQVEDDEVLKLLHRRDAAGKTDISPEAAREITIHDGTAELKADLQLVQDMKGLVVFAHGSSSSRHSPRNRFVATELNKAGFATLLADLLTENEAADRKNVFDIELLIRRLLRATDEGLKNMPEGRKVPIAYFGASTGAAAALGAAAQSSQEVFAVISRGGRPDLADRYLAQVSAPTLLIVGGDDTPVIPLNKNAAKLLKTSKMILIPKATHLFEEAGALEKVVEYSIDWLQQFTPAPKVPLPPQESVVREIENQAHPVLDEKSWNDLIQNLAKAQVVMLGEATHGTAEFYSLRRMISEKLIRDHGFDFIAVEGDWPDCQKLHDYIRTGQGGSAKNIMRQFHRWPTWMWANDETAALIEWMQSYQTGFYGLDVYSLFESLDYVKSYANRLSPELAAEIKKRCACFEPFERNEKAYAQHVLRHVEGCQQEMIQNLRQLLRLRLTDLGERNGDLFNAQQNARIVKNAEDYYRAMMVGGPDSWNIRDQHMIETLDLLLHRGFGTYQGEVLASPAWDGPETVTPLPPAKESSFEEHCHRVSENLAVRRFYMLFDKAVRNSILGQRRYGHRAVGVVYQTRFEDHGRNYVPTVMAQRYDAFVFVDRTSALRSIPTLQWTQELPETWPGGV